MAQGRMHARCVTMEAMACARIPKRETNCPVRTRETMPPYRSYDNPICRWRGRITSGTSPGMEGVGNRLRSRALELGLSDAEVARRAGLTATRYGHYVSDYREPDLATLVRICRVLGLRPDDLLAYEPSGEAADELFQIRRKMMGFAEAMDPPTLALALPVMQALAATSALRSLTPSILRNAGHQTEPLPEERPKRATKALRGNDQSGV